MMVLLSDSTLREILTPILHMLKKPLKIFLFRSYFETLSNFCYSLQVKSIQLEEKLEI